MLLLLVKLRAEAEAEANAPLRQCEWQNEHGGHGCPDNGRQEGSPVLGARRGASTAPSAPEAMLCRLSRRQIGLLRKVAGPAPLLRHKSAMSRAAAAAAVAQRAEAAAASGEILPFPDVLQFGCDDRIVLAPLGGEEGAPAVNKYFCGVRPPAPGAVFRGSVTCNTPTPEGFAAAKEAYEALASGGVDHAAFMAQLQERLAKALGVEGAGIFFSPSGSDAEYWPLLFAKAFGGPDARVLNVVTAAGEVGRGSFPAAGGLLHAAFSPMAHLWPGEETSVGTPIPGLADGVRAISVPARGGLSGEAIDPVPALREAVLEARSNGEVPVLHLVAGSKTGIWHPMLDATVLEEVRDAGGLVVVDACQLRNDEADMASWLAVDAVVLVTSSKFYRAPPFNGAAIVSPGFLNRLESAVRDAGADATWPGSRVPAGLRSFFTQHELPATAALDAWREDLSGEHNTGLAVRWAAGIAEMEATAAVVPWSERPPLKDAWRARLVERLSQISRGMVEPCYLDSDGTVSDVSVRLRVGDAAEDGYRGEKELISVHRWMTLDLRPALEGRLPDEEHELWSAAAATECFIGQPVGSPEAPWVVRVALGSDSMRQLVLDRAGVEADDDMLVRKLTLCAVHFDAIAAHEAS